MKERNARIIQTTHFTVLTVRQTDRQTERRIESQTDGQDIFGCAWTHVNFASNKNKSRIQHTDQQMNLRTYQHTDQQMNPRTYPLIESFGM